MSAFFCLPFFDIFTHFSIRLIITCRVDRTNQLFELVSVSDEFLEVVIFRDVVHRSGQVFQVLSVNHQLLEVVVPFRLVDRALEVANHFRVHDNLFEVVDLLLLLGAVNRSDQL